MGAAYRADQRLVDELIFFFRPDPGVPYVAPVYGGVDARVLFIARDPVRKPNLNWWQRVLVLGER